MRTLMQQHQTLTAPFRVSFEGGALEVKGHLTTPADVDNLVKFLKLIKPMIAPIDDPTEE